MQIQLKLNELRIIGCLIEKSLTTPDYYPLSLNALTNACNQKSNRDPVLTLSECEVQESLDGLIEERLVMSQSDRGSRVYKYKHRFCNTEFSELQLSAQELGILCILFLRGPQTPGELRTRSNRLCHFDNVMEAENVLNNMIKEKYVVRLPREPGKRESRYAHCFSGDNFADTAEAGTENTGLDTIGDAGKHRPDDRISDLVEEIELMKLEIEELREQIQNLINT